MPKRMPTIPPTSSHPHDVEPSRRAWKASTISVTPSTMLHTAMMNTSARTVGPGQNSAIRPAISDTTPCATCQPQCEVRRCRKPTASAATPSMIA